MTTLPYNPSLASVTVYENEMHLMAGSYCPDYNKHYKFNGTEWVEVSTLPLTKATSYAKALEFRGKLHFLYQTGHIALENPKATLTFMAKNLLKDSRQMNTGGNDGYALTTLRTWVNTDLFGSLPEDLQGVIKEVQKLSINGYGKNSSGADRKYIVDLTTDKCWIASDEELGYTSSYMQQFGEGETYSVFTDNTSRKRGKLNDDYIKWWTRSVYTANSQRFQVVQADGAVGYYNEVVTNLLGVCFGFCI